MYAGPWVFARKPQETGEREDKSLPPVTLIHDNAAAQALGFKGGFVGGLTLLSLASGAIDASFGHMWYEGGTLSVRHRAPVYEGDVRVMWEERPSESREARRIGYHLENRDGEESTHGWATLPKPGEKPVPPWERHPVKHKSVDDDILPEMVVGQSRAPFEAIVKMKDFVPRLDAIKDYNWWYRYASPWGPPILTPHEVCYMLYQGRPQLRTNILRSSRLRTSMDAGTDLVMYSPLFVDHIYTMKARLVDKWQTARTVFFVTEYTYSDEKGKNIAMMRAYSAHLIRDLAPLERR
ncbi:MAG: hypothetical protein Q8O43_07785 [Dehalococcoidia bacterium]|nr:hypothetical protein [Dehalococcoidia bacterium]